jgi:hypothetical protein
MNIEEDMTDNFKTIDKSLSELIVIARQFKPDGQILDIQQYGSGNINNTYLVTFAASAPFILQRLNTKVFCQPKLVMNNICVLSNYVRQRLELEHSKPNQNRRWQIPQVLFTLHEQNHYLADDGSFWRGMSFINNSLSFDTIQDSRHGQEIGYGLGMFHRSIEELPTTRLADTLAGFHITPKYLQHYNRVTIEHKIKPSPEVNYCLEFISNRPKLPYVLENAKASGELKLRTIHGDPKINNIMLDRTTGQAIAMIDLDTVKPGLIHYDIGDCLRSGCNILGEETKNWEQVSFEPELARIILKGYLDIARDFLTKNDYNYIYAAIRLLSFELGLRFFTDYLEGNTYFNINYPEHNLARALVQFKLTESIEKQKTAIKQAIEELA